MKRPKLIQPPHPCYWYGCGRFQHAYDMLCGKMPHAGSVDDAEKNPAFEFLRIATNCYYDLFHNQLCNGARDFYRVFGFSALKKWGIKRGEKTVFDYGAIIREGLLEAMMDTIIYTAAKEQRVAINQF